MSFFTTLDLQQIALQKLKLFESSGRSRRALLEQGTHTEQHAPWDIKGTY